MKVLAAISSPAQDDVIEKILKSYRHNTSLPSVTILYPFHPLVGTRFFPARTYPGPPPIYVLQLPERRLAIPVWMTEEWSGALRVADTPAIAVDYLVELATIAEQQLLDFQAPLCILPPETISEEDHDHGKVDSAHPSDRAREGRGRSSSGGSRGDHQSAGEPASSSSERGGRKGGRR